jgi:hypothetical protein
MTQPMHNQIGILWHRPPTSMICFFQMLMPNVAFVETPSSCKSMNNASIKCKSTPQQHGQLFSIDVTYVHWTSIAFHMT